MSIRLGRPLSWIAAVGGLLVVLAAGSIARYDVVSSDKGFVFAFDRFFGQHEVCYPAGGSFSCFAIAWPQAGDAVSPASIPAQDRNLFEDLIPRGE
ncbi:hypothetical protein DYI37_04045 [Fulvimarina endophytica]|uniref:Uncharacterized protein n=1 Tax=Fulvimarina endophytica TaxID=2293836 RepID=A0A371X760_9HYPH|nr:hypothetical protein [Fulvimarina endophytica]RFC65046.1 hypothetical protein DYI37_04045 [Fulvimarina endophytica]